MKKASLFILSCVVAATIYSQNDEKEHYSVSGGVLGSVDWSQFRIPDGAGNTVNYHFKGGWSGGIWINLPLAKAFSIEPQLMYSSHGYRIDNTSVTTPLLMNDGKIKSFAVPLLLKFHLSDKFALIAGPQMDFITTVEDNSASAAQKSDFNKNNFSLTGGFEICPQSRVSIFARYVHGLSSLDERTGETPSGIVYKSQAIQAGLKLKLFGKRKSTYKATTITVPVVEEKKVEVVEEKKVEVAPEPPKPDPCATDKDGDGVMDCNDKCVDVAGTASNNGCPEVQISPEVNKILGGTGQAVYFNTNSAKLASGSNASLNRIVTVLKNNPDVKIKIEGHTDNAEKDADNLSEQRANAVMEYLVSKGVTAEKIKVEGSGSATPIGDNGTAAGRSKNRRVEIKVDF